MPRWEVKIQRRKTKEDQPDWEAMGVPKPRRYASDEVFYKKMLIDTCDIEKLEEYTSTETMLKCVWMEHEVIIEGKYEDLVKELDALETVIEFDADDENEK